ncbi:MAG TPA: DNA internalization-related competence protein ComEC/Rec2 [Gemmatimonadales bacterium]|nr:DNA internalization-related competence protein ComEC/Rec2 [Gemmatimonadales bacterium]
MSRRPVLVLVLLFEAGLATGLSRFLAPWIVVLILGLTGVVLRGRGLAWLAAAAVLGFGLGSVTRAASRHSCAAVLRAGVLRLTVRLAEPVGEGVAAAAIESRRCTGPIALRVRSEKLLPAGTRWQVTGRWLPFARFGGRPEGIFVVRELVPLAGAPGLDARLRTWLTRTVARLYGARAGLVDALLTGRRGEMDPTLKAAFARSGLVHLLSISGFHVGVVFGWTILVLRLARVSRGKAGAIGAAVVFSYVAFLGWPAPATRAALLCGIGAWSSARQRHPAPPVLLAVTCLGVTLIDPWAIFDLGGWLSAAAFFGAMVFTRWSDRAIGRAAGWRMLFASFGATLATAPFTAAALGSVALAGIGLNFAAIPLAAVAVPAVILSVAVAPLFAPVAGALAAGGGLGLAGLEALARAGSGLPFGAITTNPGPAAALPWAALLLGSLWVIGRRSTSRRAALRVGWALGLAGCVTLVPFVPHPASDDGDGLALHFLSVGQGDAALIRTRAGRWILVDAGPADGRHDTGREVIVPFLVRHGVRRLAAVVLSHPHLDHVGGAPAVLEEVPADLILEPALPADEPHYLRVLELAAERGMRWRPARAGDSLVIDGVVLRVLHPDTTWVHWREDLNDDSAVLLVRAGTFEALLAGDLGVKAESLLAGRVGRVDLLKVGHHGSAGSSGAGWLAELRPRAALISVGRNRYGHPAPSALGRLAFQGVDVWRTDREGTVSVQVGDSVMSLRGRSGVRRYQLTP